MKVFSFDAETNGLLGEAFAIAAIVTDNNGEIARFTSRCSIVGKVDDWVSKNVLPKIDDLTIDSPDYRSLLESFYQFYSEHKIDADIIAYVPHPVETKLLRDMVEQDLETRAWEGPFPLIDVASMLKLKSEDPVALDAYISKHGLTIPFDGGAHHPLYDAIATEVVYRHLMK